MGVENARLPSRECGSEFVLVGAALNALDTALFHPPFILIDADNVALCATQTLKGAWSLLGRNRRARSVVGTLAPGVVAVDIDPADTRTPPEAGEAVADTLIAWCDAHGLPWLLRASGRPGGRHVIARVPKQLNAPFRHLVSNTGAFHHAPAMIRSSLRLGSAPHRHGLPSPVLASTLEPADVVDQAPLARPRSLYTEISRERRTSGRGASRSEAEFARAITRAHAGWDASLAWADANRPGTKAAEMGEQGWRRWMWCIAVTIAAADQGLSEDAAWQRFRAASPVRAEALGRDAWAQTYWHQARHTVAKTDLAFRRRQARGSHSPAGPEFHLEVVRTAFRCAVANTVEHRGGLPGRLRPTSLLAALDALADAIVDRRGSLPIRDWSARARLDPRTVRKARDAAEALGIIYREHRYSGGASDCDSWLPAPRVNHEIARLEQSPTRWYTPNAQPDRTVGQANPARLQRDHQRDRLQWRTRCELDEMWHLTNLVVDPAHPAGKTLRSLHHQLAWWKNLTDDEKRLRRRARRRTLREMTADARGNWFEWLGRRQQIVTAAMGLLRTARSVRDPSPDLHAPKTFHLGLRESYLRSDLLRHTGKPATSAWRRHAMHRKPCVVSPKGEKVAEPVPCKRRNNFMDQAERLPDQHNTGPDASRLYNLYIGGHHHRKVEREFAENVVYPLAPFIADWARQNRTFLERAVRFCSTQGIKQFLDLGAGFPTDVNVHDLVPDARVVYVDNNLDAVRAHRRQSADSSSWSAIHADIRKPETIFKEQLFGQTIDLSKPVAILMVAITHFLPDEDHPRELIGNYLQRVPPGSFLALSHGTMSSVPDAITDGLRLLSRYNTAAMTLTPRDRDEVLALFNGCQMVGPGLVFAIDWGRAGRSDESDPARSCNLAAVGYKAG